MALTRYVSVMVMSLLCSFALSAIAKADTITFTATLSGANEVPPRATNATGTATVILNDVTGQGTITVTFSGLTTGLTAGHIHCCAGVGVNAGVIVPLPVIAGSTAGTLSNFAFTLTADQITAMKNGQTYVNIHTPTYPGGEIRGQLNAVPEPGTLLLLGAGLVSVAAKLKKRRKRDE